MTPVDAGYPALNKEVLGRNLCTNCGACTGFCPYLHAGKDKVAVLADCGVETCGRCYNYCPRTIENWDELRHGITSIPYAEHGFGDDSKVVRARIKPDKVRGKIQYGGMASAIVAQALNNGLIDGAIVSGGERGKTIPLLATTEEAVFAAAGTKFTVGPTVAELNRQLNTSKRRLGVVGLPCQVQAMRKMQGLDMDPAISRLKFVVGLFCTWGLSQRKFAAYFERKVGNQEVIKVDIPPPPARHMVVETPVEAIELPLDEVKQFVLSACNVCTDMTAELADIAVGAFEGKRGWSTVIVRSAEARKIMTELKEAGVIEVFDLDEKVKQHLREAADAKRTQAIERAQEVARDGGYTPYLQHLDIAGRGIKHGC